MNLFAVCRKDLLGCPEDPDFFVWLPVSFHKTMASALRSLPKSFESGEYQVREYPLFD